jgi:hypothetical protein
MENGDLCWFLLWSYNLVIYEFFESVLVSTWNIPGMKVMISENYTLCVLC